MGSVTTGTDLGGHEPESSLPSVELRTGDGFLRAEPFDCQTAGLLTANAIAPKRMELGGGGILPSGRFLELDEDELIHFAGYQTPHLWLSRTLTAIVSFPVSNPLNQAAIFGEFARRRRWKKRDFIRVSRPHTVEVAGSNPAPPNILRRFLMTSPAFDVLDRSCIDRLICKC
jgi:hypothetical protein